MNVEPRVLPVRRAWRQIAHSPAWVNAQPDRNLTARMGPDTPWVLLTTETFGG
jgi:hypothetical protein